MFQSLYRKCLEVAASSELAGSCICVLPRTSEGLGVLEFLRNFVGVAAPNDLTGSIIIDYSLR